MDELDLSIFGGLVRSTNAVDFVDNENLTLFIPSNEAMQEYTADLEDTV